MFNVQKLIYGFLRTNFHFKRLKTDKRTLTQRLRQLVLGNHPFDVFRLSFFLILNILVGIRNIFNISGEFCL